MPEALVTFEVLLRSAGSGRTATAQNVAQFRPDSEALEKCRRWLFARGVTVHATDFSLACSAPVTVFESLFGVRLLAMAPAPSSPAWRIEGAVQVPPEISALVEDVTLPPPPEFF